MAFWNCVEGISATSTAHQLRVDPDVVKGWYQQARASIVSQEFLRASREVHMVKVYPFNQHAFPFGLKEEYTSSCTLIALCACSVFFARPDVCDEVFLSDAAVRRIYQLGSSMMHEFAEVVLKPLGRGFAAQGALARPDEVQSHMHNFSINFDALRDLFSRAKLHFELEHGSLQEILLGMQAQARARTDNHPLAFVAVVDGKTFTVMVWEQRWLCLDSHCRSLSGFDALESSVLAIGRVDMCWPSTLGEVLVRGGEGAPYQAGPAGGYRSLTTVQFA